MGPMSTSFGGAACSSLAATLTASPVTSRCPRTGSPAMTSPVLTPRRFVKVTPQPRATSSFNSASALRISAAARTARRASSSCTLRSPNTAMIASPMNFSTVPPWPSRMSLIRSK